MLDEKQMLQDLANSRGDHPPVYDVCFVCDQKITGEKSVLAATTAPHSKFGLAEKISELIGEDYVVIVTEKDVICKRCASLLNHMDKLENELVLVKKALVNYIKQKYNLPLEEPTFISATNGINNEQMEGQENELEESGKILTEINILNPSGTPPSNISTSSMPSTTSLASPTTNSYIDRKRPGPKLKDIPAKMKILPAVAKKPPQTPKMKIYKCGFCHFQSKELNNVRAHMKIHAKANVKREDETAAVPKQQGAPSTSAIKRKLFRCQVCSLSFEDRTACVDHIGLEHTSIGKKRAGQTIEQKPVSSAEIEANAEIAQSTVNTALVTDNAEAIKTEDQVPKFVPDNSEYFNTLDGNISDTSLSSDALLLNTNSAELPSLLSDDSIIKEEREIHIDAAPMETESLSDTFDSSKPVVLSDFGKPTQSNKLTVPEKPLRRILPKPADPKSLLSLQGVSKNPASEKPTFELNLDRSDDVLMDTSDKSSTEKENDKTDVHSIDIDAMIAALHSDGPGTSL